MPDVSHGVRLLLVDDDVDVATMYQMQLSAHGFQVITEHSGREAISRAGTDAPDLIYLDLGLPEMHGFDVLQQLRAGAATAQIPVVILTNFSEPELIARGRELGAHDFLVKAHTPPAALAEATRRLLL
jgi:two-component system sensor histidine kinase/response regulator